MVTVERGWVDSNHLLVAMGGVTQNGLTEEGYWSSWLPGHPSLDLSHLGSRLGKSKMSFYWLSSITASFLFLGEFFLPAHRSQAFKMHFVFFPPKKCKVLFPTLLPWVPNISIDRKDVKSCILTLFGLLGVTTAAPYFAMGNST